MPIDNMCGRKKRICIIKLGGAGDVLRTTPMLRRFAGHAVTWITQRPAAPLLNGSSFVDKIIMLPELGSIGDLVFEELYNLDEDREACVLADKIKAGKKKGYGIRDGAYFPFDSDSRYAYELSRDDELKFKTNKKTYQQIIFEMAGLRWEGEDYILGYKPKNRVKYVVGVNHLVGDKFPNKAWPHWEKLVLMLDSVSAQVEFDTMEEYIEWINSCKVIVTGDSLGMHIALALKKKVIILMGSTSAAEIETYGRGVIITAGLPCSPCYKKGRCDNSPFCMDLISPRRVCSEISLIEGH